MSVSIVPSLVPSRGAVSALAALALGTFLATTAGCASDKPADTGTGSDAGQDPGLTAPGDGAGAGTEVNSYGVAYPTDNLGYTPRAGTTPGNRIRNYKFLGYRDPKAAKDLTTISLADYFDPEMRDYKVIHLVASSVWCGPCQQETEDINKVVAALKAQKVVFVQAMVDGPKQGTGATRSDLDKWVNNYGNPFPTMLDPNVKNLGEFFQAAAVPWNANIDARSMEVLSATLGAPRDVTADVTKWTKWVDDNAPYQAK